MFILVRRSLGIVLGIMVLCGPLDQTAHAQFTGGFLNNAAILQTQGMLNSPLAYGGGFGFNGFGINGFGFRGGFGLRGGFGALGYGSLLNGGLGGYGLAGGVLSGAALGAGYGYGFGLGNTQWMMNPYQGYLQGGADITRANANYQLTISQAKLVRQEAIRSSLETRRAMIEEAEWERAHMPDPEKIRQREMERELNRARVSPPLNDIWSGRALNSLLRHLVNQQGEGVLGPKVPLSEDVVKHINVSAGDTRGNVGLIKDNADLDWPEALLGSEFKETRERLNALLKEASKSVRSGTNPSDATLNDLVGTYRKMDRILSASVKKLSPDLFIEANRYLGNVKDTITALKDPNIGNQFNSNWSVKAQDVADLVRFMREKGLSFSPATQKDEAAYVALYHALASFDAGLPRVASTNGNRGNADNADNK